VGWCLDSNEAVPWSKDIGGSNFAGASNCFIIINFVLFSLVYELRESNFNDALLLDVYILLYIVYWFLQVKGMLL
jgi:hypothetical protein